VTWQESLAWLYSTQLTGIKLGLENTRLLLDAVDNPHNRLRFLHVAGTNGKGSVCAMLDAILRQAGYRTGLYTSPHLVDFRERIKVNGTMIPEQDAAYGLDRLKKASETWDCKPTFFELTTVLAIDHFARSECDFVILETGMGGRLDSTNAVTPIVSVITPIDMDHMAWLGNTISQIAAEKAGIIKTRIPAISALQQPEAASVLRDKAQALGSELQFVDHPCFGDVGLKGAHQKWNAALAFAAILAAGIPCSDAAISKGISSVQWPARFQIVNDRLVIDGAHNRHSARALVDVWREAYGAQKATLVFGALSDKEYTEMLAILEPIAAEFFFVPVSSQRAASPVDFVDQTQVPSRVFPSVSAALEAGFSENRMVLVAGSLFLAGEVLDLLQVVCL
jgi:dihydrofolate synthase/folylpolyglutamate synthase